MFALALAAGALGCALPYQFGSAQGPAPRPVSLLRLIAEPAAYDGQTVWVAGVLGSEFEGNALYTTQEHFRFRLDQYAVSVSFSPALLEQAAGRLSKLAGRYVLVQGVYRAPPDDYALPPNGRIEQIAQLRTAD